MAILSVDLGNAAQSNRIADAVSVAYEYKATLPNGQPNPQNKVGFLKDVVMKFLRDTTKDVEGRAAGQAAEAAARAAADAIVIT